MKDPAHDGERARAILRDACQMLVRAKGAAPVFLRDLAGLEQDWAVLLHDATKWYCQALGERGGGPPDGLWSPKLPQALLAQPERCDQTLAEVAAGRFREAPDEHYAAV